MVWVIFENIYPWNHFLYSILIHSMVCIALKAVWGFHVGLIFRFKLFDIPLVYELHDAMDQVLLQLGGRTVDESGKVRNPRNKQTGRSAIQNIPRLPTLVKQVCGLDLNLRNPPSPRGGRPATTISRPRHILFIFSSEPPRNPRPSIILL